MKEIEKKTLQKILSSQPPDTTLLKQEISSILESKGIQSAYNIIKRIEVNTPVSESISIFPPISSINSLTILSPTPLPEISVVSSAVEIL